MLVRVETHMNTHRIGEATFHPERWVTPDQDDSIADAYIGRAKILKREGVIRWGMYFLREQVRTMARKNRQLAAYLPKEGNSFRGNVLVVKVNDFSGAQDIQESEIKDIQALVIS